MSWNLFTNYGSIKKNTTKQTTGVATVASASSIAVTNNAINYITGTTGITNMTGGVLGGIVTLIASNQAAGACVVLNHGTSTNNLSLRDSINLGIYAGESVTFQYNGSYWVEINRNLRTIIENKATTSAITTITTTDTSSSTLFASTSSITYDGATYITLEVFAPTCAPPAIAGNYVIATVYDGSTNTGYMVERKTCASGADYASFTGISTIRPTAGAHTYNVRLWQTVNGGNVTSGVGGAGAYVNGGIRVSRLLSGYTN